MLSVDSQALSDALQLQSFSSKDHFGAGGSHWIHEPRLMIPLWVVWRHKDNEITNGKLFLSTSGLETYHHEAIVKGRRDTAWSDLKTEKEDKRIPADEGCVGIRAREECPWEIWLLVCFYSNTDVPWSEATPSSFMYPAKDLRDIFSLLKKNVL